MTTDRRTAAWAARYQELLQGFVAAMGGEAIAPMRRALARSLATLQCELLCLSDRFAVSGKGASVDDLNLFIKISDTIESLLATAGLNKSPPSQHSNQNPLGENATSELAALLGNLVRARQEEETQGIFRDEKGNIITDPERLAIEQAIHDLKLKRDAIDNGTAPASVDVAPAPVAPCEVAPVDPAAVPNVVCIRPARAAETPPAPSIPTPLIAEKCAAGGSEQIEAYKKRSG
jgi:hypothetical protein